jgi:hypothetical protein
MRDDYNANGVNCGEERIPNPVVTKPTNKAATSAEAAKKATVKTATTDTVTLAELCKELKIDAAEARVKLRAAVAAKKLKHAAGQPWGPWPKGSASLKAVREIVKND